MSSTSSLQYAAPPASPYTTQLNASVQRLRNEQEAAVSATSQALLLHEIGVLEELLGDEAGAAREQLAAVNKDPDFREPLERLIALLERRQSDDDLGKLLERLVQIADAPTERARALIDQAAFLADHEGSLDEARERLLQAAEETPEDAAVWLSLELVAARADDRALMERALAKRAELANDPAWRTLLLLGLADLRAELDQVDEALEALEAALREEGETSFHALLSAERLAQTLCRPELEARVLTRQGESILRAIAQPDVGDAQGALRTRRTPAHVVDVWLRAAELHRAAGEVELATALVDRALAALPDEPLVLAARLRLADSEGDVARASELARTELARGVDGDLGAALWLRVADAAAAASDRDGALTAVQRALELQPRSVPARAMELGLLATDADPARLATAFEATAEHLASDTAKADLYLFSATVWAALARDVAGAKAALSQAAMFGAAKGLAARLARLLAAVLEDAAWYEESTRRLTAQGASEDEHAGLWLELARARVLRGDAAAANAAFQSLASARGGHFLGNALQAYLLPLLGNERAPHLEADAKPWEALSRLAELEADGPLARALRVAVSLRALGRGDQTRALHELQALHAAEPDDLVVAVALAALLRARGELGSQSDVLARSAEGAAEAELAAALYLSAGLTRWQAGERADALEHFESASEHHRDSAQLLLGWALRAADPNDAGSRARALETLVEIDPTLASLERFALEVGSEGSSQAAEHALAELRSAPPDDRTRAGELARALWAHGSDAVASRREALESLGERGPEAARLARALHHQLELAAAGSAAPHPGDVLRTSAAWAEVDPSPAACIEWLAAAVAQSDTEQEVLARRALAARLDGPAAAAVNASAALVAELSGMTERIPLDNQVAAARLTELELAAPGSDPGMRARALLAAASDLGDESLALVRAMAGFNQLAGGDVDAAMLSFRSVVQAYPGDVMAWEGLRASALALGDRAVLAEASEALGDTVSDAGLGARMWEEAATILLDELGAEERGEAALVRAVERDIGRFSAFDRLFRRIRARKDTSRLLELIERRLSVAYDSTEIVKLHWERARALRESGDRDGALAALRDVRQLEPDHVGALALTGEIYITLQRFEEAAEHLARLSRHAGAPSQQRLMSAVAACDLYETRLKRPELALGLLSDLYRGGLSTLPVRERLARTAAKMGDWDQATEVLEQLMLQRDSAGGRIEAARLAMVIYRDQLQMPEAAQDVTLQLLSEAPTDAEALDLVLSGVFAESVTRQALERGRDALIGRLQHNPMDLEQVDRLSRIASKLDLPQLRQAALGALIALGADPAPIDTELARLDQRVAKIPRIAIDERALPELADPEDRGPVGDLLRGLATTISIALGPNLQALGVSKRERVDPRAGLPLRNEIAAWAGALGIGEFELYIGGTDRKGVCAVPSEVPAMVVGAEVLAPLAAVHRQAVARELLALRRGTSVLRHRRPEDVHALVVAACRVGEIELPSPAFALLGEFQRQLSREMPRKVRKALPELARAVASSGQDPVSWYNAATSTLDRMAAIAAGDVSWVLAADAKQRGQVAPSRESEQRARRLLAFVLSPTYLALRDKLGMGVR